MSNPTSQTHDTSSPSNVSTVTRHTQRLKRFRLGDMLVQVSRDGGKPHDRYTVAFAPYPEDPDGAQVFEADELLDLVASIRAAQAVIHRARFGWQSKQLSALLRQLRAEEQV